MLIYERVSDELFLEVRKLSNVFGSKTSAYGTLRNGIKNAKDKFVAKGHTFISKEYLDKISKKLDEDGLLYMIMPFEDWVQEPYEKNPAKEERQARSEAWKRRMELNKQKRLEKVQKSSGNETLEVLIYEHVSDELFLEVRKLSNVFAGKTGAYGTLRNGIMNEKDKFVAKGHTFISKEYLDKISKKLDEDGLLYMIMPFEDWVQEPYEKNPTKEERQARSEAWKRRMKLNEQKREENKKVREYREERQQTTHKKPLNERVVEWQKEIIEANIYYRMLSKNVYLTSRGVHHLYPNAKNEYLKKFVDNISQARYTFNIKNGNKIEHWLSEEALDVLIKENTFKNQELKIYDYNDYREAMYYIETGKSLKEQIEKERKEYESARNNWEYPSTNRKPKTTSSWRKGTRRKKKRRK